MTNATHNSRAPEEFYRLSLQFYVTGRAAALAGSTVVCGVLFHHAVERLLKGQLSKTIPLQKLKQKSKFSHELPNLWTEFKNLSPNEDLTSFDVLIDELHKFEPLRYPDNVLAQGACISMGFGGGTPASNANPARPEPVYDLGIGDLDVLFARLFPLCGLNPKAYFGFLTSFGRAVLNDRNSESANWLP